MAIGPAEVTFAVAGAVNLGLAAWLLAIHFENRLNRALALLLTLRGTLNLTALLGNPQLNAGVVPYFLIAIPFAAVYFGLVHQLQNGPGATGRAGTGTRVAAGLILAAALACETAYLLDHGLFAIATTPDGNDTGGFVLFAGLNLVAYAALALFFGVEASRIEPRLQRRSLLLVSVGFALNPAYNAAANLVLPDLRSPFPAGAGAAATLSWAWTYVAGALVLALLLHFVVRSRTGQTENRRKEAIRSLAAVGSAVVVALALVPLWASFPAAAGVLQRIMAAAFVLSLPVLVSYSLLRHQLFGLDVRVKWAVKQSAVAGVFAVVFFIVSEAAEAVVESQGGAAFGLGAAAALAFAAKPIERFGTRVASVIMPDAKKVDELSGNEREELYMEQVRVAWADGNLTEKDRRFLDVARTRMGLSVEQAALLERRVRDGMSA